ncbi:type IV secretion system protein [Pseudoroseomonas sp. WGS1072]|uniref:type IV secretion system protein n=1 Tax=Roseomonas sp. WGS1072 TaxID=3366816 RepID=UPI003BF02B4F
MKRILLASVGAALLGAGSLPAKAQWVVWDPGNATYNILQAERLLTQIREMQMQYRQLVATYNAISHTTSIGGLTGAVGGLSSSNLPLPGELMGAMRGASTLGRAAGQIDLDRVYIPPTVDQWTREMTRRETVTANAKAMSEQALVDAQAQMASLDRMQAEIEAQPDGTAVAAHQAGIALVGQKLALQQVQLQQTQMLLEADNRVTQQRYEQQWRQDVDRHAEATAGALGGW